MLTTDANPIPRETVQGIRVLAEIAKINGSTVSLKEAAGLTSNLSEMELEAAWNETPELSNSYQIKSGLVVERGQDEQAHVELLQKREEKRARAESFVNHALTFASFSKTSLATVIGISGSASYRAAAETDDLDIFCITPPNSLWIFLTRSLILSRFYSWRKRNAPRICFSYAVDEVFAEGEFAEAKDALFARDALTAVVIRGETYYTKLLRKSPSISTYFPQVNMQRARQTNFVDSKKDKVTRGLFRKTLNAFLFFLVGNYIKKKSDILNRQLRSQGKQSSVFAANVGFDHCVFESVRYAHLRSVYDQLDSISEKRHFRSNSKV